MSLKWHQNGELGPLNARNGRDKGSIKCPMFGLWRPFMFQAWPRVRAPWIPERPGGEGFGRDRPFVAGDRGTDGPRTDAGARTAPPTVGRLPSEAEAGTSWITHAGQPLTTSTAKRHWLASGRPLARPRQQLNRPSRSALSYPRRSKSWLREGDHTKPQGIGCGVASRCGRVPGIPAPNQSRKQYSRWTDGL